MTDKARVLIVAADDLHAGPLAEGLDRLGWRTLTARGPYAAAAALSESSIEAAIVDLSAIGPDAAPMARRLKTASAPRRLPIIALGETDGVAEPFDLALPWPLHPEQAAQRLEGLVRLAVAEEQFDLRAATFADRGRTLALPSEEDRPLRVLVVGSPAPSLLALSNALADEAAEVVGAFTAYTAFDYLHERTFEAVVLVASDESSEALAIATGMRRNTKLYHIPAILHLADALTVAPVEAFAKGVTDILAERAEPAQASRRVLALASAFRRELTIRQTLEKARASGLMDPATGLFTRELFAAHLARLAEASKATDRTLAVVVLKLGETRQVAQARRGCWLDRAIPQIGSMIGRLVRVEDTAARLGTETFAVALPSSSLGQARAAGERIGAVIACTAFEAGDKAAPFVAEFDVGAAEIRPGDNPAEALEAAARTAYPARARA